MKKIKIILIAFVLLITLSACYEESNLKEISYSKINKMLENEEDFFFIVIKDGCSYCESFVPKVKEIVKEYDIVGYILNISDMSTEESKEFEEIYKIGGTPTTIFITKGKETSIMQRIDGNVSKEKILSKLKANNYISE